MERNATLAVDSPASQPGLHLQRIATIFSRLSPLFAHLRRSPEFSGNTLLPNALSPIAPVMAYGHCGTLEHSEARQRLQAYDEWLDSAAELQRAYRSYKQESGNALLWAGWNYWGPSEEGKFDNRVIQLVFTPDLLSFQENLVDPDRCVLGNPDSPLLTVKDFLRDPFPEAPGQVKFGENLSNDLEIIPPDLLPARLLLYNLWEELFVPSINSFRARGYDTIVDHMLHEHKSYRQTANMRPNRDFGALFDPYSCNTDIEDVRIFNCRPEWSNLLWEAVAEQVKVSRGNGTPAKAPDAKQALLQAWHELTTSGEFLEGAISPALDTLIQTLGSSVGDRKRAYVILQHLVLFSRFLCSNNQYVFPISFGQHLFVAFMAMRQPLGKGDADGWRQIGSALFGSLLVELLTDLYSETRIRHDALRRADEQRLMLSHSLPKSVFKPAEYFAVKLYSQAAQLTTQASGEQDGSEITGGIDGLHGTAAALLFLLQRGQAEILAYAEGESNQLAGRAVINLYDVCVEIAAHGERLKEFFIAGYIDRAVQSSKKASRLRDEALDKTEIIPHLENSNGEPVVRANRGLLLLHLWNIVDNAFRFANLSEAGLLLNLTVWTTPDQVCLRATNTGRPISTEVADLLNSIFSSGESDSGVTDLRSGLVGVRDDYGWSRELEGENRGIGLVRLNDYLTQLWTQAGKPNNPRGAVKATHNGTQFEFYFPRASE